MSNTTSNSVTNANRGGGGGGGGGGKCVDSSLGQEVPCTSNGGWWSSETNCYLYLPPGSMPIDAANNYIWVCQGQGSIVQKTVIAPLSAAGPVAPPPPPDPRDVAQLAIKSMALRAIKIGGRGQWRVEASELEAYIQRAYADAEQFVREHPFVEGATPAE